MLWSKFIAWCTSLHWNTLTNIDLKDIFNCKFPLHNLLQCKWFSSEFIKNFWINSFSLSLFIWTVQCCPCNSSSGNPNNTLRLLCYVNLQDTSLFISQNFLCVPIFLHHSDNKKRQENLCALYGQFRINHADLVYISQLPFSVQWNDPGEDICLCCKIIWQ